MQIGQTPNKKMVTFTCFLKCEVTLKTAGIDGVLINSYMLKP